MPAVARFYSPQSAPYQEGERAYLSEAARHHAGRVLRAVAGDPILVFDGKGNTAQGPIAFEGKDAWITVQAVASPIKESPVELTLIQSFVSNDKADWIVEKAVETGVAHIVFVPAARSVTRLVGDKLEKRLARWQDIVIGACEQCGRNVLPSVTALSSLEAALKSVTADVRWLMHPGETSAPVLRNAKSVAFAVGPEGGFSEEEGKDAWITVQAVASPIKESPVELTLIQSFVSNDKADWIVEKAVETGVAHIVFVPAARSVTRLVGDKLEKRLARWQDIVIGACEQCGRNVLPSVTALSSLEAALKSVTADVRWLMHPGETSAPVLRNAKSVAFAVGPEGGFSEEEVAQARDAGWQCAVLGPRVLRTETAGLAAAVFLNTKLGDFV